MSRTLHSEIERLEKLDAERTPGKWENGCHPANERLNIVRPIMFGKYVGKLPECEGGAVYFLHKPNAEYIASAPDMMAVIREQQRHLAVAREALQFFKDNLLPHSSDPEDDLSIPTNELLTDGYCLAEEALAATNPNQELDA